jgi:hypothetical protein
MKLWYVGLDKNDSQFTPPWQLSGCSVGLVNLDRRKVR